MNLNRSRQIKPVRAARATRTVATTLLLLAVTLSSCTKEPAGGEQPLPDGAVRIVLSVGNTKSDSKNNSNSDPQTDPNSDSKTRATEDGSAAENRIANIKVLFYDHATQTLDLIKHIDDVTAPNGDETIRWESNKLIITGVTNQSKAYDIYVIANWTDGFNAADFAKDTPITNLTAAFTRISGQIATPDASHALLMSGSAINHIFSKSATAQVALMRQVAKIRVNVQIGADFKTKYPDAVFGAAASPENNQLTVYNIPNSSYVYGTTNESRYNTLMAKEESKLLDYPTITMTPAATETVNVYETETVYVYENITLGTTAQAKEKATFMVLRLPYKLTEGANAVTENYYKFHVQDNADRTDPHKTKRNHIYDLTATVVGFGSAIIDDGNNAFVTTTVRDWNVKDLPDEELGDVLDFSKFTPAANETFTLKDGDYVIATGETLKAYCKTNVGGWYAFTYRNDESTPIHKSTPTDEISSTTEQDVDIVLPATTSDIGVAYTIKLYHPNPKFAPAGEPFKTLTVKQAAGVIPNSVLVKSFKRIYNSAGDKVDCNGWPVDSLPEHGLQLAKHGNVLPSDRALSGDPVAKWSTVPVDVGGTELGCGFGKLNTDSILVQDAATADVYDYPAVNECKDLGDEWYLPSLDELSLIAANKSSLGSSYLFGDYIWWSSTQYNNNDAWNVYFGHDLGVMGYGSKPIVNIRVRCVRNL